MKTTSTVKYRVYEAPEGCGMSFCGECDTLEEAQALADSEPTGLHESQYDTARAAGHCDGMSAPDGGVEEDDDPISWHGKAGWHCVVRVKYPNASAGREG